MYKRLFVTLLFIVFLEPVMTCEATILKDTTHNIARTGLLIDRVRIEIAESFEKESRLKGLARYIIPLKDGQVLTEDILNGSIEALMLSKRFKEIHVDFRREHGSAVLVFNLRPYMQIKDITVHGEYPLFEREVLGAMTIDVGDNYDEGEVKKQEEIVAGLYRGQGYITPVVRIYPEQDDSDGNYVLSVEIEKGGYFVLETLRISGNRAFSDARIMSKMGMLPSSFVFLRSPSRFIERRLKDDIDKIRSFYRNKGYYECEFDYEIEKDQGRGAVSAVVSVREGPVYEIVFDGNKEFWDWTLNRDLNLEKLGNKGGRTLRRGLRAIRHRYSMYGYHECSVTIRRDDFRNEGGLRRLMIHIDEGGKKYIDSIAFAGHSAEYAEGLEDTVRSRKKGLFNKGFFIQGMVENDLSRIRSFYLSRGYVDTAVRYELQWSQDRSHVSVMFHIEEGYQILVRDVDIIGLPSVDFDDAFVAIGLTEGEPFQPYMVTSDENTLSAMISEKGHPYVNVRGELTFSDDKKAVTITYKVDEGPYVSMGTIYYSGNFRTREKVIRGEIGMEPGDPFSLRRMLYGQKGIRDMAIFDSVQFKTLGLREKRKKISLVVDTEEKEPYFIQLGAGYESRMGLYGNAKAGDRNLFGANKDASVSGEMSQVGSRMELSVTEPRLLFSKISANLGLYTEKRQEFNQDFGLRTIGGSLGFNRRNLRYFSLGLGFRFEERDQFLRDSDDQEPASYEEDEFGPRSVLVTTPSVSYDTRDSFVRPQKGLYSTVSVDISRGVKNSLDNFHKYRLDARFYITPVERLTLALLGRAGYVNPYGSGGIIPDDQLLYLGGTLDVRGFDENLLRYDPDGNPIGGKYTLTGSMEARINVARHIELAVFLDTGSVRDAPEDSGSDSFRSTIGAGLRYMTPIGPMGVLYGHKLDRKTGESPGRFHFSVGYTF